MASDSDRNGIMGRARTSYRKKISWRVLKTEMTSSSHCPARNRTKNQHGLCACCACAVEGKPARSNESSSRRPAVEAGRENLGFLPGDLKKEENWSYIRRLLWCAVNDMIQGEESKKHTFGKTESLKWQRVFRRGNERCTMRMWISWLRHRMQLKPVEKVSYTEWGPTAKFIVKQGW